MSDQLEFVRDVDGFAESAKLWRCGDRYVITSSIGRAFDTGMSETLVFRSNEAGEPVSLADLPGSSRGTTDHEEVAQAWHAAGCPLSIYEDDEDED